MNNYDACKFLHALDPNATEFNFHSGPDLSSDTGINFRLHPPSNITSIAGELDTRNSYRCRVSVQINESANGSRRANDIVRVRAIWQEDDGQGEGLTPLPPSLTVQSSPGRYHRYWFVTGDWPADEQGRKDFDDCMRGMVTDYGSDPNATNINKDLRLPGTINWKYAEKPVVEIIHQSNDRYTREELVEAFAKTLPPSQLKFDADTPDYGETTPADVQTALRVIPSDDRETWLKVGMGLHHEFGDAAHDLWAEWSKQSRKYEEADQLRTWESFSEDRANPITIASVFAIANAYGWNEPSLSIETNELKITPVDIPRQPNDLTERTMAGLRLTFEQRNHHPSEQQMDGLQEAAKVIQGMADGTLGDRNFYISFLAPGIGKTSTVVEAVRNLTRIPEYDACGVIILLSRLEEIRKLVEEIGLSDDEFSVVCRDNPRNREIYGLGNQHKQQARVMFTTQQMVEKRCKGSSFEACDFFHWNGKPRQVRIWDEAILPAKSLTIEMYALDKLIAPIARHGSPEIAENVRDFGTELRTKDDKSLIEVIDLKATQFGLETMLSWFDEGSEEAATMEALYKLSGLTVRVRRQGTYSAVLDYEDTLPSDLGPMLVLDASGKTRKVYPLWQKHREGVKFLLSPEKRFEGLTIHIWNKGSGRDNQRDNKDDFVQAFNAAISSLPDDESILAVVHKAKKNLPDFATLIGDGRTNLSFAHYGNHTATNDFKNCKHVMLVGILNYSIAQIEAMGRGAMAMKTEEEFPKRDFEAVRRGEVGHNIYQAACRGQVRLSEGDHCPQGTTLWVACPTNRRTGFSLEDFEALFPGATIVDWNPIPKKAKGHVKRLNDLEQTPEGKQMTDVEKAAKLGVRAQHIYRLKQHPDYWNPRTERITTKREVALPF